MKTELSTKAKTRDVMLWDIANGDGLAFNR